MEVIDMSMDVPFDPAKWIRAQKIYKDVPLEVSDAYAAAREMPPNLQATLPSPALSVTEFLSLVFPRTLDTKHRKSNQTDPWFSTDLPNCDNIISTLWTSKSLPSPSLLLELDSELPQRWLNGTCSIVDPLDNHSVSRYTRSHSTRRFIPSVTTRPNGLVVCLGRGMTRGYFQLWLGILFIRELQMGK